MKDTTMKDLQVIQEETGKESPPMKITEEVLKEEIEALHMKTEDIEEKEVIAETEGTTTMEAAGRGSEETAGRVSVSEGLL